MHRTAIACLMLALAAGQASAQGQDSASSAAQGAGSQRGAVEVGAGATSSAISTGASGPQPQAGRALEPLEPRFRLRPPDMPFFGPGQLDIAASPPKRCDVIQHEAARRRCELPNPATTGEAP